MTDHEDYEVFCAVAECGTYDLARLAYHFSRCLYGSDVLAIIRGRAYLLWAYSPRCRRDVIQVPPSACYVPKLPPPW